MSRELCRAVLTGIRDPDTDLGPRLSCDPRRLGGRGLGVGVARALLLVGVARPDSEAVLLPRWPSEGVPRPDSCCGVAARGRGMREAGPDLGWCGVPGLGSPPWLGRLLVATLPGSIVK